MRLQNILWIKLQQTPSTPFIPLHPPSSPSQCIEQPESQEIIFRSACMHAVIRLVKALYKTVLNIG